MTLSVEATRSIRELKEKLHEEADKTLRRYEDLVSNVYKATPKLMALLEKNSMMNYRHDGLHELSVALSAIPNDGYHCYVINVLKSIRPLSVIERLLDHKEDMPLALNGLAVYCKKNKLAVPCKNDTPLVMLLIMMLLEDRPLTISFEDLHKHPSKLKLKCYDIKE